MSTQQSEDDAIREAMRAEWDANHADQYAHRGISALSVDEEQTS